MSIESRYECVDKFDAFDECGWPHEIEVWADIAYSLNAAQTAVRTVGKKHLRMAASGNVVHAHVDGSLEDSGTGLRVRMNPEHHKTAHGEDVAKN